MVDMFDSQPAFSVEAERRLQNELLPGERLIWAGQPRIPFLVWSALPVSLFGLLFGGFALFWITGAYSVTRSGAADLGHGFGIVAFLFPLFGLPFLLVGLGLVASPYLAKIRLKKTFYGLTDQRALLLLPSGLNGMESRNYALAGLDQVIRTERSDGSGDLVFAEETSTYRRKGRQRTRTTRHGFMGIAEVRKVEELIRIRRAALGPAA